MVLHLLAHGVPSHWIEQMDEDAMVGWVWGAQLYDGDVWSDMAGHPVPKTKE